VSNANHDLILLLDKPGRLSLLLIEKKLDTHTLYSFKSLLKKTKPMRLRKFPYVFLAWKMTLAKEIMERIERQFRLMSGLSSACPC
jgi:hypothetical protein